MISLPIETIKYFIDFLDLDSLKNFGRTSSNSYTLTFWSPRYLSAYLSSYFTTQTKYLQNNPDDVGKKVKTIFESIEKKECTLDRPFRIYGNQLEQLPHSVWENICVTLILTTYQQTSVANDFHYAPLLSRVRSLLYDDQKHVSFGDGAFDFDFNIIVKAQQKIFLQLLEKMSGLEELIFGYTNLSYRCEEEYSSLKPCESIKKIEIGFRCRLCNEKTAKYFLTRFPMTEQITFHGVDPSRFISPGYITTNSFVKQLCFKNSTIQAHRLLNLLIVIPTVEKIAFHSHKDTANLLSGLCGPKVSFPIASVREFHISTGEKEAINNKDFYLKGLCGYFPNLLKFEMIYIEQVELNTRTFKICCVQ